MEAFMIKPASIQLSHEGRLTTSDLRFLLRLQLQNHRDAFGFMYGWWGRDAAIRYVLRLYADSIVTQRKALAVIRPYDDFETANAKREGLSYTSMNVELNSRMRALPPGKQPLPLPSP
jgi:hypothetical protein